ncbi:MAG: hypothetical protein ACI9PY_000989 [Ascidiaceihabitans sp.]|jgi:hypothetical protein
MKFTRRIFSIFAVLALAACTQQAALVDQNVKSSIYIKSIVINAQTLQKPITGRDLVKTRKQIGADVKAAVTRSVQARGLNGPSPATLHIALTKVQLVSPGQSWAIGGKGFIEGVVSVKSASGKDLIAPQTIKGFSEDVRLGGLIGALTAPTAELDYAQTVQGFANGAVRKIFEGGLVTISGDIVN